MVDPRVIYHNAVDTSDSATIYELINVILASTEIPARPFPAQEPPGNWRINSARPAHLQILLQSFGNQRPALRLTQIPILSFHSALSVTIGSTFVARRAGM